MGDEWGREAYMYGETQDMALTDRIPKVVIEKPEDIQSLLDSYITTGINYGDSYYGMITFRKTAPFASSLYNYQTGLQGSEDLLGGGISSDYMMYFDSEDLPEVLSKAFKSK